MNPDDVYRNWLREKRSRCAPDGLAARILEEAARNSGGDHTPKWSDRRSWAAAFLIAFGLARAAGLFLMIFG